MHYYYNNVEWALLECVCPSTLDLAVGLWSYVLAARPRKESKHKAILQEKGVD